MKSSREFKVERAWRAILARLFHVQAGKGFLPTYEEPQDENHPEVGEEIAPPGQEDQYQAHGGDDQTGEIKRSRSGVEELCDGKNNDCDGEIDEGTPNDDDGDGYTEMTGDCDDSDPTTYPYAEEILDEKDNDCDGEVDEEVGEGDSDGDGDWEYPIPELAGERNHQQVFSPELIEQLRSRRLARAFADLISRVAEDLAGYPIEGDDEWSIEDLMLRSIDRRPLSACRMSREKEAIVMILDTSGSCSWQAEFFSELASLAIKQGDVELYLAPNAYIESVWSRKERKYISVEGDGSWSRFRQRHILFFGDFDGGDSVVLASKENHIWWFSCEDRYDDLSEHDWNSHSLSDFRGEYIECFSPEDFMKGVRRLRIGIGNRKTRRRT